MTLEFRRDYLVRLPLPLAQLYSRAFNAKDARGRHDNAFYLTEALIKLAACPAISCYLDEVRRGAPRVAELDQLLAQLALPSLGQWVAMLRELARYFGRRPDAAAHPLGHLTKQLETPHRDRPALLALFRRIKNGPDGQTGGDQSCSLLQVLDALVQYRNAVFGHGGPRFDTFFDKEMGPLLFPAVNDLLDEGVLDLLGPRGSRLVYLTELRLLDENRVEVGLRELVGRDGERMAPLTLNAAQAGAFLPNRVAVLWPGRPVPLRLDPLLQYREGETAEEVLFLNRDRHGRQAEYLSYTTGRTERDKSMAPALAALLTEVTGHAVSEDDLAAIAERSHAGTSSIEGPFAPTTPTGQQLGDYEILAELGRGGMGVVFLARQLSLGRLVALKMLPADLAGDEVALARFRREIRHLAGCEHPNIVKVLSNGVFPDGRLYFTMEYVPGCDLENVWKELAASAGQATASTLGQSTWASAVLTASRKQRDKVAGKSDSTVTGNADVSRSQGKSESPHRFEPGELPLPPLPDMAAGQDDPGGYVRRVVTMVRDAALALQAVHDRDIVHRDVKPANLMLTADGSRVVLMDFGLAKGQSLGLTASKQAGFLGTLRYAAPEQLASAMIKVGPAADVRALGCVLWELLTRRRLFAEAQDEAELAARVLNEDLPCLRSVAPDLDRDLEAIVSRCTERSAADRIPSAAHLADYLQLYLDGKPLSIRPTPLHERAIKWAKRRPAIASLIGVSVLAVVSLLGLGFVWLDSERQAAEDREEKIAIEYRAAQERAEQQEKIAKQQKEIARIQTEWAVKEAALRQRADKNFQEARAAVDEMLSRIGHSRLAQEPRMEKIRKELLEEALKFYERFEKDQGDDPGIRFERARAELRMGKIYALLGQHGIAEKNYTVASGLFNDLTKQFPKESKFRVDLANSLNDLGTSRLAQGHVKEAQSAFQKADEMFTALLAESPNEPKYLNELATMQSNLSTIWQSLGQPAAAEKACRQAMLLREGLIGQFPKGSGIRQELAKDHMNLGGILRLNNRLPEAEKEYASAITLMERSAAEQPEQPEIRHELAVAHHNVANLFKAVGKPVEAERSWQRALNLLERLAVEFPSTPGYRQEQARSLNDLGILQIGSNRMDDAEKSWKAAIGHLEKLLTEQPDEPTVRIELANTCDNLGQLQARAEKLPQAEENFRRAVDILEEGLKKLPLTPTYGKALAGRHANLGALMAALNRPAEAEKAWLRRLEMHERLVKEFPQSPELHTDLAAVLSDLGGLLLQREKFAEARPYFEKAVRELGVVLKEDPKAAPSRKAMYLTQLNLALTLVGADDHRAATRVVTAALEFATPQDAQFERVAGVVARCVPLVDTDVKLDKAEKEKLAMAYGDQVVDLLKRAIAAGFRDVTYLRQGPEFAAVREREDFQALIRELEGKKDGS